MGTAAEIEQKPVIAVQVKSMEMGTELSPEVEAALPHVSRLVLEELGMEWEATGNG